MYEIEKSSDEFFFESEFIGLCPTIDTQFQIDYAREIGLAEKEYEVIIEI